MSEPIVYKNPTPVAVNVVRVILPSGVFGILALERGIEPCIGGLALPGGYVDEMETIEMAAAREFLEETDTPSSPRHWQIARSAITPNNRVLVFCLYDRVISMAEVERMVPNAEALSFKVVQLGDKLCFPLHQQFMEEHLRHLADMKPPEWR